MLNFVNCNLDKINKDQIDNLNLSQDEYTFLAKENISLCVRLSSFDIESCSRTSLLGFQGVPDDLKNEVNMLIKQFKKMPRESSGSFMEHLHSS